MTNVLIVGANSFVGNAVSNWLLEQHKNEYCVDIIDAIGEEWKSADFSKYDVVYQVAGIAHIKKETPEIYFVGNSISSNYFAEILQLFTIPSIVETTTV